MYKELYETRHNAARLLLRAHTTRLTLRPKLTAVFAAAPGPQQR